MSVERGVMLEAQVEVDVNDVIRLFLHACNMYWDYIIKNLYPAITSCSSKITSPLVVGRTSTMVVMR
jgi:hypothetical protein